MYQWRHNDGWISSARCAVERKSVWVHVRIRSCVPSDEVSDMPAVEVGIGGGVRGNVRPSEVHHFIDCCDGCDHTVRGHSLLGAPHPAMFGPRGTAPTHSSTDHRHYVHERACVLDTVSFNAVSELVGQLKNTYVHDDR